RLEPRELPPEVGKRPMDVSKPGFTMTPQPVPGSDDALVGLEGALRVLGTAADEWSATTRAAFQSVLIPILNAPHQLATTPNTSDASGDPIVGPPVYGCWHAGIHEVPATAVP